MGSGQVPRQDGVPIPEKAAAEDVHLEEEAQRVQNRRRFDVYAAHLHESCDAPPFHIGADIA